MVGLQRWISTRFGYSFKRVVSQLKGGTLRGGPRRFLPRSAELPQTFSSPFSAFDPPSIPPPHRADGFPGELLSD